MPNKASLPATAVIAAAIPVLLLDAAVVVPATTPPLVVPVADLVVAVVGTALEMMVVLLPLVRVAVVSRRPPAGPPTGAVDLVTLDARVVYIEMVMFNGFTMPIMPCWHSVP